MFHACLLTIKEEDEERRLNKSNSLFIGFMHTTMIFLASTAFFTPLH